MGDRTLPEETYSSFPEHFSKTLTLDSTDQATSPQNRSIRLGNIYDIPRLCAISGSATKKFASIPTLADLANDYEEPLTVQQWLTVGNVYIVEEDSLPLGFIAAHPMDNTIYIAEIAVHSDHQGKGIGGVLLKAVCRWATERARYEGSAKARVSLTTYPDVPWNGRWYARFGFREVEADVVGPWHVEKMTKDGNERRLVREGYRRCCMLWETATMVS